MISIPWIFSVPNGLPRLLREVFRVACLACFLDLISDVGERLRILFVRRFECRASGGHQRSRLFYPFFFILGPSRQHQQVSSFGERQGAVLYGHPFFVVFGSLVWDLEYYV